MRSTITALLVGLLFGVGLIVSGMTQPSKVITFLDVAGGWDPSLGLVMAGAIGVHFFAYRLVGRMQRPLFARAWALPSRKDLDPRLLGGAALFGAGWGLGGYCPGPALTSAATGATSTLYFTGAMLVGMGLYALWERTRGLSASPPVQPIEPSEQR